MHITATNQTSYSEVVWPAPSKPEHSNSKWSKWSEWSVRAYNKLSRDCTSTLIEPTYVRCTWSIERLILIDHQCSLHLLDFCTQKRAHRRTSTLNTVINCDLSKIQPQIIIYDFIDGNLNPFVFAARRCVCMYVCLLCARTLDRIVYESQIEIQQKFNVLNILLDFFLVEGDQWRIREFCDWIRTRFDLIKIDWDSNCVCVSTWCIEFVYIESPIRWIDISGLRKSCHE